MKKHISIYIGKYEGMGHSYAVRAKHNNFRYWACFELGKPLFFTLCFLIIFAPQLLNPLFIIWFLEKFLGWEAIEHSRFINYIKYQENKK